MAYSLWAQPTGPLADQLQVIINEMADKHNTPRFVPHVTVAGPIEGRSGEEVLKICTDLAETLPAYRLRFDCVGKGSTEFHSDGERAELTEQLQELLSLAEDGVPALLSESFAANTLALWRTPLDGPPEEWAQVAEVPLKGSGAAVA
ncbi:hypothetical protein WJX81_008579 [Elliptochloris bilobata]|uniref:RNA ligase/cyclic nucleotide phosphodiesterase family protein n=1 Tax=Elliptochloris bilobata TaxID=381761 RepID=A0AAW1SD12_9CHLO